MLGALSLSTFVIKARARIYTQFTARRTHSHTFMKRYEDDVIMVVRLTMTLYYGAATEK